MINYNRLFWQTALRYFTHHGLLVFALAHNYSRLVTRIDAKVNRILATHTVQEASPDSLKIYQQVTNSTHLWHGTGRFQYTSEGTVVDTLASIIKTRALTPRPDVYSIILTGQEMNSISATTVRIIGRSYADTHGKGTHEPNRYGTSLWWVAFYYNLTYADLLIKHSPTLLRNWRAFSQASSTVHKEKKWGKKSHLQARGVWDAFGLGSDIPHNYPILFGIKSNVTVATLPTSMQKWEARIMQPVGFEDMTHIEVPSNKISEVQHMLNKNKITLPVVAIETGEYAASQLPVSQILYGRKT